MTRIASAAGWALFTVIVLGLGAAADLLRWFV